MSLTKYKSFQQLLRQEGNYLYIDDKSTWPIDGYQLLDIVTCTVWSPIEDSADISINFYDESTRILLNNLIQYNIFNYGVPKWPGSAVTGDIVWLADKVWKCLSTTGYAPDYNQYWEEVNEDNIDELNAIGESRSSNYYYYSQAVDPSDDIFIEKTADHKFIIQWLGSGNITKAMLLDYNGEWIRDLEFLENTIDLLLLEDGAYSVQLIFDTEAINYGEVFDFTDSEKCYLNMLVNTICECNSCEDCTDEMLNRILTFISTYQMIRDIVNANLAVNTGLVSTEVLRTEYMGALGLLMAKLNLMVNQCTCNDS